MKTKFTQFVNNNYIKDSIYTVGLENVVVVFYRAACMKSIPQGLKEYAMQSIQFSRHDGRGRKLYGGNDDDGDFDAIMVKDISYNKLGVPTLAKIYITAILRCPFTGAQQDFYEELYGLPLKERIYHPWDSESCNIIKK